MKLISKNCPNCGAGLKFKSNDKEVTCEYCKQSFIVEGNEQDDNLELISEAIKDNVITGFKVFSIMHIVGLIIFFLIFFAAFAFIIFVFIRMARF